MHLKNMKLVIMFKLCLEPSNVWLVKYIGGERVPQFHCVIVASNWSEFLGVVVPSVLQYHGGGGRSSGNGISIRQWVAL